MSDEFHNFPRGLKTKLAIFYNCMKCVPACAICWSTNRVSIHHYYPKITDSRVGLDPFKRNKDGSVNWDDLSQFILLCGGCHGKVERNRKSNSPFINLVHNFMQDKHPIIVKRLKELEALKP